MCFAVISCEKQEEIKTHVTIKPSVFPKNKVKKNNEIYETSNSDLNFVKPFKILLPREYRDWENKNPANALSDKWVDLYQKNGKYYLGKPDYTIKRSYSECSGDSTQIISSKNKTLLFINQSPLKFGEVKNLEFDKNKIWPGEKLSFKYNDNEYLIRAEGKVLSSEKVSTDNGLEIYKNVENYKLFIKTNFASESLFLKENSFNDTFVGLLFAGDIDRDGKLDFIFGANRDYEEERVILYLSSEAKKDDAIKKTAEIAVQFDC